VQLRCAIKSEYLKVETESLNVVRRKRGATKLSALARSSANVSTSSIACNLAPCHHSPDQHGAASQSSGSVLLLSHICARLVAAVASPTNVGHYHNRATREAQSTREPTGGVLVTVADKTTAGSWYVTACSVPLDFSLMMRRSTRNSHSRTTSVRMGEMQGTSQDHRSTRAFEARS
jgi:hypothetical protein